MMTSTPTFCHVRHHAGGWDNEQNRFVGWWHFANTHIIRANLCCLPPGLSAAALLASLEAACAATDYARLSTGGGPAVVGGHSKGLHLLHPPDVLAQARKGTQLGSWVLRQLHDLVQWVAKQLEGEVVVPMRAKPWWFWCWLGLHCHGTGSVAKHSDRWLWDPRGWALVDIHVRIGTGPTSAQFGMGLGGKALMRLAGGDGEPVQVWAVDHVGSGESEAPELAKALRAGLDSKTAAKLSNLVAVLMHGVPPCTEGTHAWTFITTIAVPPGPRGCAQPALQRLEELLAKVEKCPLGTPWKELDNVLAGSGLSAKGGNTPCAAAHTCVCTYLPHASVCSHTYKRTHVNCALTLVYTGIASTPSTSADASSGASGKCSAHSVL